MLWQLLIFTLLLWAAYMRYINRHKRKMMKTFKKHKFSSLPVIGVGHHLSGSDEDRMNTIQAFSMEAIRLGGHVCDWVLHELVVLITDPEDAEVILRTNLQKTKGVHAISDLIGDGHIFADVHIWRPRRKVMTTIFTQKNLNTFVSVFSRKSEVMIKKLEAVAGRGSFSIWKYVTSYSLDAICETTLGTKANVQSNPDHPFLVAFDESSKLMSARIVQPWLHPDFIYKMMPYYPVYKNNLTTLQEFVKGIIKKKKKEMTEKQYENKSEFDDNRNEEERPVSFLELLLQSGEKNGFTDIELQEEMLVLAMAGTDTSAVGAAFAIVMLSQYAEVQQKVYEEITEVFENSERPVTHEDLVKLKYLEAVIKESMRLYPPVPGNGRMIDKKVTTPSGHTFVEGTAVIISIWGMHRNPKYWGDDAEDFRPERFYNTTLSHSCCYMPFSHGPRNCIGWKYAMISMMTLIANLIRWYKILPSKNIPVFDPQNPKKRIPLRTKYDVMMKHVDNYQVEIERR